MNKDHDTTVTSVKDWEFTVVSKQAILDDDLVHKIGRDLGLNSTPDMVFANRLTVSHCNGAQVEFNAKEVLNFKEKWHVAGAEVWANQRATPLPDGTTIPAIEDNWTFTTEHHGVAKKVGQMECSHNLDFVKCDSSKIGFDLLMKQDPILTFASLPFFEDELSDSGNSSYQVKMSMQRAMDSCFLILARFFLRVDGVGIRYVETRIFHENGTDEVAMDITRQQLQWDSIKHHFATPATRQNLLDPNKCAAMLPKGLPEHFTAKLE